MGIPHISYSGSCTVNGTQFYCRDATVNTESKPTFYDHTVGLTESIMGVGGNGNPGLGGGNNIQKKFFRYSPVLPKASVSGLLTQTTAFALLDLARYGGTDPLNSGGKVDVEIVLWTNGTKQILESAYMQSLSIEVRAGDVASFTAEFVGQNVTSASGVVAERIMALEKLLTWDAIKVAVSNANFGGRNATADFEDIAAFSLTVNNPVLPIYTANTADLLPKDLRLGIQEITGSVTTYEPNSFLQGEGIISFDFSGEFAHPYLFNVAFEPPSDKASASAIYMCSSNFVGFADSGSPWL